MLELRGLGFRVEGLDFLVFTGFKVRSGRASSICRDLQGLQNPQDRPPGMTPHH